jgi:hypothetical protein
MDWNGWHPTERKTVAPSDRLWRTRWHHCAISFAAAALT